MNKKILLFSAALGITYLGITSYDDGPAKSGLNRTGAVGSSASCGGVGCHANSSSATVAVISLTDKTTSTVVSNGKYLPGRAYTLTVSGTCTSAKSKFGFQVAATKADNSNAGTMTPGASGTAVRSLAGLSIGEHAAPLTAISTGVYSTSVNWTAPAKGAGTITFYGILNAVDGDGTTSNDLPSKGVTAAFTEDAPSGIAETSVIEAKIYPNPCTNLLHIEGVNSGSTAFSVSILDFNGRLVLQTNTQNTVDVSSLTHGIYIMRINNGAAQQTTTFIKN